MDLVCSVFNTSFTTAQAEPSIVTPNTIVQCCLLFLHNLPRSRPLLTTTITPRIIVSQSDDLLLSPPLLLSSFSFLQPHCWSSPISHKHHPYDIYLMVICALKVISRELCLAPVLHKLLMRKTFRKPLNNQTAAHGPDQSSPPHNCGVLSTAHRHPVRTLGSVVFLICPPH